MGAAILIGVLVDGDSEAGDEPARRGTGKEEGAEAGGDSAATGTGGAMSSMFDEEASPGAAGAADEGPASGVGTGAAATAAAVAVASGACVVAEGGGALEGEETPLDTSSCATSGASDEPDEAE